MIILAVVLLLAGLGLLVAEAHLPTFGVLGTAGIASVAGGIVLAVIESGGSVALALALALPVAAGLAAVGVVAARAALVASRRRPRGGSEGLIGHVGVVRGPLEPLGHVFVDGELWRARRSWADEDVAPGDPVVVEQVQGLTLSVRRAEEWEVER